MSAKSGDSSCAYRSDSTSACDSDQGPDGLAQRLCVSLRDGVRRDGVTMEGGDESRFKVDIGLPSRQGVQIDNRVEYLVDG